MEKRYYAGTWQQRRAFSPAVETRGGRTLWVAGHGATHDAAGIAQPSMLIEIQCVAVVPE